MESGSKIPPLLREKTHIIFFVMLTQQTPIQMQGLDVELQTFQVMPSRYL